MFRELYCQDLIHQPIAQVQPRLDASQVRGHYIAEVVDLNPSQQLPYYFECSVQQNLTVTVASTHPIHLMVCLWEEYEKWINAEASEPELVAYELRENIHSASVVFTIPATGGYVVVLTNQRPELTSVMISAALVDQPRARR